MFTVHLTESRFYFNMMAAMAAENLRPPACPETLHIGFESEPNVNIGDDVLVVVDHKTHESRQIGTVLSIHPPDIRVSAAVLAERESRIQLFNLNLLLTKGVDIRTLPQFAEFEEFRKAQWILILKHKSTEAPAQPV